MYKPDSEWRKEWGWQYHLFNILGYVRVIGLITLLFLAGLGILNLIK